MRYDPPDASDNADMALGMDFRDLTRDEQAVLAYATLLNLRCTDGMTPVKFIAEGLALSAETIIAIVDQLYQRGLAWLTGPTPDLGDCVDTGVAQDMRLLAVGPGGRPNAREWADLREVVFDRFFFGQEPYCVYCKATGTPLVLDHFVPVSRGGSNHPGNLVPACAPCNGSKRNLTLQEWNDRRAGLSVGVRK